VETLLHSCVKVREAIELPFGVVRHCCIRWGSTSQGEGMVLGVFDVGLLV